MKTEMLKQVQHDIFWMTPGRTLSSFSRPSFFYSLQPFPSSCRRAAVTSCGCAPITERSTSVVVQPAGDGLRKSMVSTTPIASSKRPSNSSARASRPRVADGVSAPSCAVRSRPPPGRSDTPGALCPGLPGWDAAA